MTLQEFKLILKYPSKIFVISDIHGDYYSLQEALNRILPEIEEEKNYLIILGDNIDRFPWSELVMKELIYLNESYGEKVIFLLGNHEWGWIGGPVAWPRDYYLSSKEVEFIKENFKIIAMTEDVIFLHGGIPNKYRNIWTFTEEDVITQIAWNDPDPNARGFEPSPRTGYDPNENIFVYGQKELNSFLEKIGKKLVISGHGHINDVPLFGQIRVCSSRISRDGQRSYLIVEGTGFRRVFF